MTIVSVIAYWNQAPNEPVTMVLITLFFLFFTFGGVYLVLSYAKYRLCFDVSILRQNGIFSDRRMDLRECRELIWRRFPEHGSVKLLDPEGAMKIDLGHFSATDRERLVEFLRQSIPETKQFGWEKFHPALTTTLEKQQRSRAAIRILAVLLAAHVVAFGVIGVVRGDPLFLVMAVVNGLAIPYLLHNRGKSLAAPSNETS